ncbi:hypothetical protein BX600DRAFT_115206 [Xylariales sp. PMI_506]|nr:hypothetical protein BX600DRAFT_115206 [Xylariales sp. PMI_506]
MMIHLPVELVQWIFFYFEDLETLRNAVLCCRLFYRVFVGAEQLITTRILLRQIHPSVIPHAVAVFKSSFISGLDTTAVFAFCDEFLTVKEEPPASWKLADALRMSRFHHCVDYFATRLSSAALDGAPCRLREPPQRSSPTQTEVRRVQRALYRFQLFCNLFSRNSLESRYTRDLFFSHFSAWENEQLACVNELLIGVAAKPFNDLVDHDIHWGSLYIAYLNAPYSAYGEYILSKGLEFLYRLATAQGYTERRQLLSIDDDKHNDEPGKLEQFLTIALNRWANAPWDGAYMNFSQLDSESKAALVGKPFYEDLDPGPAAALDWLQGSELPGHVVGSSMTIDWRAWGYVFWDMARLEGSGILLGHREDARVFNELITLVDPDSQILLQRSQVERAKIKQRGGSGWWSFEDQAKVVGIMPSFSRTDN